jgi:hypothetical protein
MEPSCGSGPRAEDQNAVDRPEDDAKKRFVLWKSGVDQAGDNNDEREDERQ